ncbi:MAG: D-alanyl-D-alanine carboxypeptidase/D-alanyl-D-alanine-endopeptidase [Gammaproteobacteria bacterium]|nr:D-alanyl-D-alanine carboxypeptidase/D-alanyl-D-alanine-endopeptidase [Gammaproteobacteria bacterium]
MKKIIISLLHSVMAFPGRRCFPAWLLVALLPISAFADTLPSSISQTLKRYDIPVSDVSIEIRDIESNQSILSVNSNVYRNPASVIKLITTLAALELLGPQHQWKTRYYVDGKIRDDVLVGNLVLRGGGDPFLTVDRFWNHVMTLRGLGIRSITGNLIIDNTLYDIPKHARSAFDGAPSRLYNVAPDAALVNFSANRLVIQPLAGRVSVRNAPPLEGMKLINQLKPKSGKCSYKTSGWNYRIDQNADNIEVRFEGAYSTNCGGYSISRSLLPNNEYTYRLFKQLWMQSGGTLDGSYRVAPLPENSRLLSSHFSVPLSDLITSINKYSNNVMARMLFLNLDAGNEDDRATLSGARNRLANWLLSSNIKIPDLYVDNGSGLSRTTRITSKGIAELLDLAWQSLYRPEFLSSLPLASLDGTMRKRLGNSPLAGRARIKTGSVKGVRSMAGYVVAGDGKPYSVTVLIQSSNVTFQSGNQVQDAVLKWIHAKGN